MIATTYLMEVESSISCSLALPTDPETADFIVDFELLQKLIANKSDGDDPSSKLLTILAASF
jgi:hypothetical protein